MGDKRKKIGLTVFLFAGLLIVLLVLGIFSGGILSPFPYLHLESFSGKVVDTDTKMPIEGAAVLAVYYKSVPGVAGSNSYTVDGQEVLTDDKGEFVIPETRRWFALHRGYSEGNLIIFKPGYGTFPDHERTIAVAENKSWPSPEKYVVYELPKLKKRESIRSNLPTRPEIPYEKMKSFVKLINKERVNLGFIPLTIPKEENQ